MDKNGLIGLGLIGAILATFMYLQQPSAEEIAQQEKEVKKIELARKTAIAEEAQAKAEKKAKAIDFKKTWVPKMKDGKQVVDATGAAVFTNTVSKKDTILTPFSGVQRAEKIVTLENSKLKIDLSTKGGAVSRVILKKYQSYNQKFIQKNKGALVMFDANDAINQLKFKIDNQDFASGQKDFELVKSTKETAIFSLELGNDKEIQFIYRLNENKYDLEYEIKMNGFGTSVRAEEVKLNWNANLRQMERLLSEERKVATVFFKPKNTEYDYLSETSSDNVKAEDDVSWVAFKNSYFSSILAPETPFNKKGTAFFVNTFAETNAKNGTHVKNFVANLNLGLTSTENVSKKFTWYFGPNKYEELAAYKNDFQDIINYGWGLFRWINLYAITPIFDFLASTGMSLGIAILLLTLILKLFLMPVQWKMYVSSAKMRILKPEVDEINKKFPNKDDAMKKQSAMMSLYRESGASPLAGCLPSLIQMPILLAVFRFFPASFDLRQKNFLWAEDLSSYDSVLDFGYNIPFYGDHISLFTLLMAGTTLVYTWLNNSNMAQNQQQPGMPNMKVIMYIFPFMMIFFFNNFASGLSYYYFISTLISILLTLAIKYFFVDEEKLRAKMVAKKATSAAAGPKKKSKMQLKIEEMQKAQQDRLKKK
jgi:YidC/Oxa1 family membrane protein insertase